MVGNTFPRYVGDIAWSLLVKLPGKPWFRSKTLQEPSGSAAAIETIIGFMGGDNYSFCFNISKQQPPTVYTRTARIFSRAGSRVIEWSALCIAVDAWSTARKYHWNTPSIPVIQIFTETAYVVSALEVGYVILAQHREFRVHDPVALATVPSEENLAQPKNRSNELINHAVSIFVCLSDHFLAILAAPVGLWSIYYKNGNRRVYGVNPCL